MIVTIISSFFFFLIISAPLFLCLGVTSIIFLCLKGLPLVAVAQRMLVGVDSFSLMAVPFFLLAGELMNSGGITQRLVHLANSAVGPLPGGLAHVTVVTNMIMAGLSGSAVADCSATAPILIPAMEKSGYSRAFAGAISAAASTIGPVIPPSIPFVIYGSIADVSIGRLFLGGAVPGVLMGLFLMAVSFVLAKKRGYTGEKIISFREKVTVFMESIPALLLPCIVLIGIVGGIFTATEASVVAVVYALFLSMLIYRTVKPRDLLRIIITTSIITAAVLIIASTASLFGWILAREQIPMKVIALFSNISNNPIIILLIINGLVLLLGCLMDVIAILLILTPVLMPLVHAVGIDPVHFGVVYTVNLMIGLLTPPVGMCMFVVCSLAKLNIEEYTKEVYPFILALILLVVVLIFFPSIVLFLPNLIMGKE